MLSKISLLISLILEGDGGFDGDEDSVQAKRLASSLDEPEGNEKAATGERIYQTAMRHAHHLGLFSN